MAKTTSIVTLSRAEKFFNKQLRYVKKATRSLEKAEKFIIRTLEKTESDYFLDWYFSEKNSDVSIRLKIKGNPAEEIISTIDERMAMYSCQLIHLKSGKFVVKFYESPKENVA